jgi:DNA-binding transcriptional ArsR family regulator
MQNLDLKCADVDENPKTLMLYMFTIGETVHALPPNCGHSREQRFSIALSYIAQTCLSHDGKDVVRPELPMPTTKHADASLAKAAELLSAMANQKRMLILDIISKEEVSVGSLAVRTNLSQSALSQHLGKLRVAKLVQTRRDAQTIFYRCDSVAVTQVLGTLSCIFGKPQKTSEIVDISDRKLSPFSTLSLLPA